MSNHNAELFRAIFKACCAVMLCHAVLACTDLQHICKSMSSSKAACLCYFCCDYYICICLWYCCK